MIEKNKVLLMTIRQALLLAVDAIEQYLGIEKTSGLRKLAKMNAENTSYTGEGLA